MALSAMICAMSMALPASEVWPVGNVVLSQSMVLMVRGFEGFQVNPVESAIHSNVSADSLKITFA